MVQHPLLKRATLRLLTSPLFPPAKHLVLRELPSRHITVKGN
ncbi:hypothetical protein V475_20255 [Sphingobium baderi LL03]|uniref:Uncharacterized protein n=1 Tax=Sphingobium baderi LL03 TaxID=1114964 RepID=T0HH51_9SPHN|nr:hypothetical protein L485_22545 [Sphingobium baderi LL03]KMS64128.1 hypothetical protein V475_20255 [Sphingobium baderi LL03]